ncbi:hypothetical protein [Roseomonas sp. BN140053]|uniref:hypothetical protein n=1 Tax=Roseomonas sp. BN140053 TaxID=3391898 RepID=UPI0039EBA6DF
MHALGGGRFELRGYLDALLRRAGAAQPVAPDGLALELMVAGAAAPQRVALHGRLGPNCVDRPADTVASRRPDAAAALAAPGERLVLFAATAAQGPGWDALRGLAEALRDAGCTPWLLLCTDPVSFEAALPAVLNVFEVGALAVPARQPPDAADAWNAMPADPALEPALARLLARCAPARLVVDEPLLLARLGRPAAGLPRAVLLNRAEVTGPQDVFGAPRRRVLITKMRARLNGSTAVLPDEGLRLVMQRLCPGLPTAVVSPGCAASLAASALGLAPAPVPLAETLRRRLFAARLGGVPATRAGLLLDGADGPDLAGFVETFMTLAGPDRVFRMQGGTDARPLAEAVGERVQRLLVAAPGADGRALAALAEGWGLPAVPLLPGPSAADAARLAALRGAYAGQRALVADAALLPAGRSDADLVLVAGLPAAVQVLQPTPDVVALSWPGDPRRGRIVTLFDAEAPMFWTRPPEPATGYAADLLPLATVEGARHPLEALLAFVLLAGCVSVRLLAAPAEEAALAPMLERLAAAGMVVQASERKAAA